MRTCEVIENKKGEKLFTVFHLAKEKGPLIMTLHGFASHKVGSNRSYVKLAEALRLSGISTCRFDFRGSGDSEGDLSTLAPSDLLDDVLTIYHALEKKGFDRIGFFGSSFGGTLAIEAASLLNTVKSIATWAPVANCELWLKSPKDYGITLNQRFKDEFLKLFANKTLENLPHLPFLHFQGTKDEVLSIEHQEAFRFARKQAHAPTRFLTYENTGHTLGYAAIFPEVLQITTDWFQRTL